MKLILALLLLTACTEYVEMSLPQRVQQEVPRLTYQDLWRYDLVQSYAYLALTPEANALLHTSVVQGDAQYIVTNTLEAERAVISTMVISRETHACITLAIVVDGEHFEDECPSRGLNSYTSAREPLSYAGAGNVEVPVGNFSATVYRVDGVTYYHVPSVPIPVKYVGDGYEMLLVTYE